MFVKTETAIGKPHIIFIATAPKDVSATNLP